MNHEITAAGAFHHAAERLAAAGKDQIRYLSPDYFICYEFYHTDANDLLQHLDRPWMHHKTAQDPPDLHDPQYEWRYVSGSTLYPAKMGSLIASAYYAPGTIEIFEAMCIPSRRDQVCMPWRFRLPPHYHGKKYQELVADLIAGAFVIDPDKPTCDDTLAALPVALFRSPGKNGCLLGYVFTVPPPTTPLDPGDFVYCLAPPAFGAMVVDLLG